MQVNASPQHLQIKQDGKPVELFMSYALLNKLVVIVGGVDGVTALAADPAIQEQVLLTTFIKREGKEVVWAPESLEEIDVGLEDIGRVLDWVGGHVTDFFLKQTENSLKIVQKYQERLVNLERTSNGLANLVSRNPAASSSIPTPPDSVQ